MIDSVAIRCDALYSCHDVKGFIRTTNGGNMYFSGFGGAYTTDTNNPITIQGDSSMKYDIFCTGTISLYQSIVRYANNLYCTAYRSCAERVLVEYINKIWGYGYRALEQSTINEITNFVYCATSESCYQSVISNILNGDVYGNGYQSLYDATVTNVNGSVIGFGYQAMYLATIKNATNVEWISNYLKFQLCLLWIVFCLCFMLMFYACVVARQFCCIFGLFDQIFEVPHKILTFQT